MPNKSFSEISKHLKNAINYAETAQKELTSKAPKLKAVEKIIDRMFDAAYDAQLSLEDAIDDPEDDDDEEEEDDD